MKNTGGEALPAALLDCRSEDETEGDDVFMNNEKSSLGGSATETEGFKSEILKNIDFQNLMDEVRQRNDEQPALDLGEELSEEDREYQLITRCNSLVGEIDDEMLNIHRFVRDISSKKFPELESIVTSPLDYLQVVQRIGDGTKDLTTIDFSDILPDTAVRAIAVMASTAGTQLPRQELDKMLMGCDEVFLLIDCKRDVLQFLESRMMAHTIRCQLTQSSQLITDVRQHRVEVRVSHGVSILANMLRCRLQQALGHWRILPWQHMANFLRAQLLQRRHEALELRSQVSEAERSKQMLVEAQQATVESMKKESRSQAAQMAEVEKEKSKLEKKLEQVRFLHDSQARERRRTLEEADLLRSQLMQSREEAVGAQQEIEAKTDALQRAQEEADSLRAQLVQSREAIRSLLVKVFIVLLIFLCGAGVLLHCNKDNQPTALALPADSQTHGMNMHANEITFELLGSHEISLDTPRSSYPGGQKMNGFELPALRGVRLQCPERAGACRLDSLDVM